MLRTFKTAGFRVGCMARLYLDGNCTIEQYRKVHIRWEEIMNSHGTGSGYADAMDAYRIAREEGFVAPGTTRVQVLHEELSER